MSISYQVGRTGSITPVANLVPVHIAGTTVKRASLHNADIIASLDIHEGDYLLVEKGGEIIPKIVGVDMDKRKPEAEKVEFITECPICGSPLVRKEGEANHYCLNGDCPPRVRGSIEHFVSRNAMDIEGMGTEIIDLLLSKGMISDVADIYSLSGRREEMIGLEKVIYPVEYELSDVPWEVVFYALDIGLPNMQRKVAEKIAGRFGTLKAYSKASPEELSALGLSAREVAQITEYFSPVDLFGTLSDYSCGMLLETCGDMESVPFDCLLAALGINGVDMKVADILSTGYDYIYELSLASEEELAAISGIGPVIAGNVCAWMGKNRTKVKKLNTLSIFRMQSRMADNLLASIEKSKDRGFSALLNGLGIRYIGEGASRDIARHFGNMEKLMQAGMEELKSIEGIGEQMAGSIVQYFSEKRNRDLVRRLLEAGVSGAEEEYVSGNRVLEGKIFVITGTLSMARENFKDRIMKAGGKVTDSVSSKTDYLLAGEKAGSKLDKALKLGVQVLDEEAFNKILEN